MAFMLYHYINGEFHFLRDLQGRTAQSKLWGKGQLVEKCARKKARNGGPWHVTEREVLDCLDPPEGAANCAILDDLVTRTRAAQGERRELRVARVLEIRGYLDGPYTNKPGDCYNPILITMEEVLHVRPDQIPTRSRSELRETIVPTHKGARVRSFNYLWNSWCTSGRFRGALLEDRHWDCLIGSRSRTPST
jgi:hypothetical protein